MAISKKAKRNPRYVRLIKAGCKFLGLDNDEEARRGFYERTCGKRHIEDMDDKDLLKLVRAIRAEGFAAEDGNGVKKHKGITLAQDPLARKIRSLWLELRDAGALRDSSEKALLLYVKRRTKVDRMEWLKPNQKAWIIEQLKAWLDRINEPSAGAADAEEYLHREERQMEVA